MKHRTVYECAYKVNGRATFERPEDGQYDIAAIKTIYKGDRIVSKDMVVAPGCWVDSNEENAFEKAIALRNNRN